MCYSKTPGIMLEKHPCRSCTSFINLSMVTKKKKKFDALLRPTREPLCVQLTDRRSAVVRECCICIAKICLVRQGTLLTLILKK